MAKSEGSAGRWPAYSGPSEDVIAAEIFTRLTVHEIRRQLKRVTVNDMNDEDIRACRFDKYADLAMSAAKQFLKKAY